MNAEEIQEAMTIEDASKLPADFAAKSADFRAGTAWAVEYITGMLQGEIALREEAGKMKWAAAVQRQCACVVASLNGFKDDLEELGREIGI